MTLSSSKSTNSLNNKFSQSDFLIILGNVVHHYNTTLYTFLVPILAPIFFPSSDKMISLIMAYGALTTSIFMRPLGAFIFGTMAKKIGPNKCLVYSLAGIGITTLSIGILPSFEKIGVLSPILLLCIKSFGDIFASGESAISKVCVVNDKTNALALRGSYFFETATMGGILLASIASTLAIQIHSNYCVWRLYFVIGALLAFVIALLRKAIQKQSDVGFTNDNTTKLFIPSNLLILWRQKVKILNLALVNGFAISVYTFSSVTMNGLMPVISNVTLLQMTQINTYFILLDTLLIPIVGTWLTKTNRPTYAMLYSVIALTLFICPFWYFVKDASIYYIALFKFFMMIVRVFFTCPLNVWYKDLISGSEKYMTLGVGLSFGVIISKLTPVLCLTIYKLMNNYMYVVLYMFLLSALATLVLFNTTKR